jgi:hypothetical protein
MVEKKTAVTVRVLPRRYELIGNPTIQDSDAHLEVLFPATVDGSRQDIVLTCRTVQSLKALMDLGDKAKRILEAMKE